LDSDKDGLSDKDEESVGWNPYNPDMDGDGLSDGAENGVSDPRNPDTDGDGFNDKVDGRPGDSTRHYFPDQDTDKDGIPDEIEDPNQNGLCDEGETPRDNPDMDGDGLLDGEEDANHNGKQDPGETSPQWSDSDADGLPDGIEMDPNTGGWNTDPLINDTDGDGILDGDEDKNKNGKVDPGETNPTDADTDDDGVPDKQDAFPNDYNKSAKCPDGIEQPGEKCDDGNWNNDDACTIYCEKARCGDNYEWTKELGENEAEQCDDGSHCTDGHECTRNPLLCKALGLSDTTCKPRSSTMSRPMGDACDENCKNEATPNPTASATPNPTASVSPSCSLGQIQYYCASVPNLQGLHRYRRVCLSSRTWGSGEYWNYCSNGCSLGVCLPGPAPTTTPS